MTQKQMFPTSRPRPKLDSDEVYRKAAERLLDASIIAWVGDGWLNSQRENYLNEIMEAFDNSFEQDGYEMAKYLDDHHNWTVNSELVEILNGASLAMLTILDELTRAWVKDNDIKPLLKVGDIVRVKYSGKVYDGGKIVHIDAEEAKYHIYIEAAGMTPPRVSGTTASVQPFEVIEALNHVDAEPQS